MWGFSSGEDVDVYLLCCNTLRKVKQSRYTPWWRLGERRCSSYSFLTSALDGGEWSASRPGRALPPGKGPPVPIVQEAGWAPEPVWTQVRGNILCPCRGSNLDRPIVQSVVRHYIAWTTKAPTPYALAVKYRRFGRAYCHLLQVWRTTWIPFPPRDLHTSHLIKLTLHR
jgi:hypothetical protein